MSKRSPIEQVKSKKPEKLNIEMCLEVGMVRERLEAQGQEMKALHATIARLTTELAEAREDSVRLTWCIEESNGNGGWLADHVWDDATKLCPLDYQEADDVQKWVRAAIDAARKGEAQ